MARSFFLFALALTFYWYEFLIRVALGPMFKSLMLDLQLDAQSFGLLSSSFLLPYALLQIPAGLMLDRYPTGRVLGSSCLLCALSTLGFALSSDYSLLILFRTLSGVGSAVAVLSCMKIALTEFPQSYFGIFAGVILFMGGVGAISGKILLSMSLQYLNWRSIMLALGGTGLLLAFIIFMSFDLNKSPLTESSSTPSVLASLKKLLSQPLNLAFGLYALLMTAPSDAFAGLWSSLYFSQVLKLPPLTVEMLGSIIFVGMALGSPLATSVDHILKKRFLLAGTLSLLSAALFYLIVYVPQSNLTTLSILCFFYGVVSVYVLCFVMAQQYNSVEISGLVSGFINTLSIIGSFSLQTLIGTLMTTLEPAPEITQGQLIYSLTTYHWALSTILIFYLVSTLLMLILPLIGKSQLKTQTQTLST